MTCKECIYFKKTYPDKSYCELWDKFVKAYDNCEEGEEK